MNVHLAEVRAVWKLINSSFFKIAGCSMFLESLDKEALWLVRQNFHNNSKWEIEVPLHLLQEPKRQELFLSMSMILS